MRSSPTKRHSRPTDFRCSDGHKQSLKLGGGPEECSCKISGVPDLYRGARRRWAVEPDPQVPAYSNTYQTVRADLKELTGSATPDALAQTLSTGLRLRLGGCRRGKRVYQARRTGARPVRGWPANREPVRRASEGHPKGIQPWSGERSGELHRLHRACLAYRRLRLGHYSSGIASASESLSPRCAP
jgi:hypothetical protein